MRLGFFLFLCLCFSAIAEDADPVVLFDDGDNTGYLQSYASMEMQTYFQKMFSNPVVTDHTTEAGFRVVLGTPANNSHIAEAVSTGLVRLPEGPLADQGYALKSADAAV